MEIRFDSNEKAHSGYEKDPRSRAGIPLLRARTGIHDETVHAGYNLRRRSLGTPTPGETVTLVCKSCFPSKWMLSLMAVKRILRFTSSSTM
jgi:hypothetical protein